MGIAATDPLRAEPTGPATTPAANPAADPCVIKAQRASVGVFKTLEQARRPGTPFSVEAAQWIERNLWKDPDTLILRFFEDAQASEPFVTITEDLTETGMILTTRTADGARTQDQPFTYTCRFNDATGAYRFDMYYESTFGDEVLAFVNQIEGHGGLLNLVRLARPKGSREPYRWISTLTAARVDAED